MLSLCEIILWYAMILSIDHIGPILDDRLKEKILKPWKGAHSSHFRVCLSVCNQATEHIFWPRNLIFGLSDPFFSLLRFS